MSEWWTYRLSDFLMFSPSAYGRLVALYNRELWPGPLLALAAGLLALYLAGSMRSARGATDGNGRVLAGLLAFAWAWVAWAFCAQRYATIFLGGPYLAAAFAAEVALLLFIAIAPANQRQLPGVVSRVTGWLLAWAGVLAYPLLVLARGRPWTEAEVFGWMPDPTALATLGLLLATGMRAAHIPRWVPMIVPLLVLAVDWAMRSGGG